MRPSAVRASSPAAAAICWVDAEVSSVLADICSDEAEEDSATVATPAIASSIAPAPWRIARRRRRSRHALAHVPDRVVDALEGGAGCATVATPSLGAAGAVLDDADDAAGLGWISPTSAAISAAARCELLGELADLVGDDREAAALLAGAGGLDRGVERQQVRLLGEPPIVSTIVPICETGGQLADRARRPRRPRGRRPSRRRRARRRRPVARAARASLAASAVCRALEAASARRGRRTRRRARAASAMRTCFSAPDATSPAAMAISPTARPASSEVAGDLGGTRWTPRTASCGRRRRAQPDWPRALL